MLTKAPNECHYGILSNYDGDGTFGVFMSFIESTRGGRNYAYDQYFEVSAGPEWFGYEDCEHHWSVPEGYTEDDIHRDMKTLGFNHLPDWDANLE